MFIVPVYEVLCYTVAKHGLCQVCKKRKSTPFTYDAFVKIGRNGLNTMYFTLSQRRLRWLDHILRMGDERIPKSLLYIELVDGRGKRNRQTLPFKDVCKRDLKSLNIGANDCDKWRFSVYRSLKEREKKIFKRPKKTKNSN